MGQYQLLNPAICMAKRKSRQNIPTKTQNQVVTEKRAAFYQGPIPPPSVLEGYNNIVPDAAERIIRLAEEQSNHRMNMETKVIQSNVMNERLGVVFAFVVVLVSVIGGIAVIMNNKSAEGLALVISSLCALAGVFIAGKYYQKKAMERDKEN